MTAKLTLVVCVLALPLAASAAELKVLTDRTESHLVPIFKAFEKATGITVKAVFLEKGLLARLQSRPTEADLVITKDADLLELARGKNLLQPFASPAVEKAVPARFRDPKSMYFSDSYRARVLFYSRDRVKPEDLSSYAALVEKRWKGRICIRSGYHDYNLSLFGQMFAAYGKERARRLIAGLRANLARTPTGSDRDQARAIHEKKCDVAIANSYYMGIMLSSKEQRPWGEATRVFFPDQAAGGTFILRSGLALTKAKANLKAATQFLEHVVRDETQDLIANLTFAYPVSGRRPWPKLTRDLGAGQRGVKDGLFKIHEVPLAEVAKQRDAVIRTLDELKFDKPL